ncbi:MAG: hypothetical protein ABI743_08695 [bacterium]
MRPMTRIQLAAASGLLVALSIGLPAAHADDPAQWPGAPDGSAVTDFQKPANYIANGDYTLYLETTPPVPDAGQPFTFQLRLRDPQDAGPLSVAPTAEGPAAIIVTDKNGRAARWLTPSANGADGSYTVQTTFDASGPHYAYVAFTPQGGNPVVQRFPFWVEGVAVNGVDVTHNLPESTVSTSSSSTTTTSSSGPMPDTSNVDARPLSSDLPQGTIWAGDRATLDSNRYVEIRDTNWNNGWLKGTWNIGNFGNEQPMQQQPWPNQGSYDTSSAVHKSPTFWYLSNDMNHLYLGSVADDASFQIPIPQRESGWLWVQMPDGSVVSRQY